MVAGDGGRRERTRRRRQVREDAAGTATVEAEAQGRWQAMAETDGGEETGKEENNGSPVEAREAGPEELFDSQCKMSFLSFCFWEQQTPFGGAFSFWSFLEKQKLPKASPNRALGCPQMYAAGHDVCSRQAARTMDNEASC